VVDGWMADVVGRRSFADVYFGWKCNCKNVKKTSVFFCVFVCVLGFI